MKKLDETKAEVQVVITAPSRELATQIFDACKQIAKHFQEEIRLANYVGGTDKLRQIEKLKRQPAAYCHRNPRSYL